MPVTFARDEADYPALALAPDASGRLVYDDGVEIGYRGFARRGVAPLHAFGSGFGYAGFTLGDVRIAGANIYATVTNTAARAGNVVVQVYRHAPEFALVGFAKAILAAGESRAIEIPLEQRALRRWADGWQPLTGVDLSVGFAADALSATVRFEG